MVEVIYNLLKEKQLNPYMVGFHEGECEKPLVVIKEGIQLPTINSRYVGYKTIDIILLVPLNNYGVVKEHRNKVVQALKGLDWLKKSGMETPVITDNDKKAFTMSMEYVLYKKLEG